MSTQVDPNSNLIDSLDEDTLATLQQAIVQSISSSNVVVSQSNTGNPYISNNGYITGISTATSISYATIATKEGTLQVVERDDIVLVDKNSEKLFAHLGFSKEQISKAWAFFIPEAKKVNWEFALLDNNCEQLVYGKDFEWDSKSNLFSLIKTDIEFPLGFIYRAEFEIPLQQYGQYIPNTTTNPYTIANAPIYGVPYTSTACSPILGNIVVGQTTIGNPPNTASSSSMTGIFSSINTENIQWNSGSKPANKSNNSGTISQSRTTGQRETDPAT